MVAVFERPAVQAVETNFRHLVTLINYRTGDEAAFEISTPNDSFAVVMREIAYQRNLRRLGGYQFFEALPL